MLGSLTSCLNHMILLLSIYLMTSKKPLDINKRKKVSNLPITQEQIIIEFCPVLYCSLFYDNKTVKIRLIYDLICEQIHLKIILLKISIFVCITILLENLRSDYFLAYWTTFDDVVSSPTDLPLCASIFRPKQPYSCRQIHLDWFASKCVNSSKQQYLF